MSIKKTAVFFTAVILLIAFSLTACSPGTSEEADENQPITIKLAHVVNEKDGFHVAAVKFKELVEEQSQGNLKIEIYPNATLGDERTLIEGMQVGTIDMGVITNGPVANFLPEIAVFEMPFLFASAEEAYKILDGQVGQNILENLKGINLVGLAYAERGFRNLTNSKTPVRSPADIEGLKIRVMENPVYLDTFNALGANAVPMAWTDALTALQQKTIDGQENPINVIYSYKLNETQDYLTMSKHSYAPAVFLMSKKLFDSLSEDLQDIVKKAAQDAAAHERKDNAEQMAAQLKELEDNGMIIIEDPDLKAFQDAVKPVYEKYGSQFGALLDEIERAK